MTELYLAWGGSKPGESVLRAWDWTERPMSVLVSFEYLSAWDRVKDACAPARTMLDSGAFSAYNAGRPVDFEALCREAASGRWDEAVALDVIGDPDASLRNAIAMRDRGLRVMPVFHIGEPWSVLNEYVRGWDRVGLSCRFGESVKESLRFYRACFAKGWPCRFHSFGWIQHDALVRFPFASADAATAVLEPGAYRRFRVGKRSVRLSTDATAHGIRGWLEHQWKMQQQLKARWRVTLAALEDT